MGILLPSDRSGSSKVESEISSHSVLRERLLGFAYRRVSNRPKADIRQPLGAQDKRGQNGISHKRHVPACEYWAQPCINEQSCRLIIIKHSRTRTLPAFEHE